MGKNEAGCEGYFSADFFQDNTLPETEIAPENRPKPKRQLVFQPSIFRCYVSVREGKISSYVSGLFSGAFAVSFRECKQLSMPFFKGRNRFDS